MSWFPNNNDLEGIQNLERTIRIILLELYKTRDSIGPSIDNLRRAIPGIINDNIKSISAQLQANGAAPINVTNLLGLLTQPQVSGNIDTHANRLVNYPAGSYLKGTQFIESDRHYLYEVLTDNGPWSYISGVFEATLANQPADLGTNDVGARFYATDNYTHYIWTGAAWITIGGALWKATVDSTTAYRMFKADGVTVIFTLDSINSLLTLVSLTTSSSGFLNTGGAGSCGVGTGSPNRKFEFRSTDYYRISYAPDPTTYYQEFNWNLQDIYGQPGRINSVSAQNITVCEGGGNFGIGKAVPGVKCDVTGVVAASTGFNQNGTETTATNFLASNGTNFVGRAIVNADLPNSVTAHTITLAKITPGGANGSITWDAKGLVTAYVDPT